MILFTAPQDLRGTGSYEACLHMLRERYDEEYGGKFVFADGDLPESSESGEVSELYVLSREDGTVDAGVYRQWEHLSEKHGVPATLLYPMEDSAAELGKFSVSVPGDGKGSDRSFAEVTPASRTSIVGGNIPESWSRRSR